MNSQPPQSDINELHENLLNSAVEFDEQCMVVVKELLKTNGLVFRDDDDESWRINVYGAENETAAFYEWVANIDVLPPFLAIFSARPGRYSTRLALLEFGDPDCLSKMLTVLNQELSSSSGPLLSSAHATIRRSSLPIDTVQS